MIRALVVLAEGAAGIGMGAPCRVALAGGWGGESIFRISLCYLIGYLEIIGGSIPRMMLPRCHESWDGCSGRSPRPKLKPSG